jgi:hypothetical protein
MADSDTKSTEAPKERPPKERPTESEAAPRPVDRPPRVPRTLTQTEREALRARLQKKFH